MNQRNRRSAWAAACMALALPGLLQMRAGPPATNASAFSRQSFSADLTITGKQGTYHGKMYAGPAAVRTDVRLSSGVTTSVIVRYDKGVEWILIPGRRYIQSPIEKSEDLLGALRDKTAHVEKQNLGRAQVGKYACEKYRVKVSARGRTLSGVIWVARAKQMNGFIVKAQNKDSGKGVELSAIRLAPPDPSLFDLPAGYRRIAVSPKS